MEGKMEKLIKLRKKYKYSGTYMAQRLNISKPFYWQLEHGQRRLTYDMAIKIANVFDLKPDEIFYKDYIRKKQI